MNQTDYNINKHRKKKNQTMPRRKKTRQNGRIQNSTNILSRPKENRNHGERTSAHRHGCRLGNPNRLATKEEKRIDVWRYGFLFLPFFFESRMDERIAEVFIARLIRARETWQRPLEPGEPFKLPSPPTTLGTNGWLCWRLLPSG